MKKLVAVIFVLSLVQVSCKKTKTCTCEDNTGKVVYNETTTVSGKTQAANFDTNCKNRESTYYTTSGSITTSVTVPCKIS